MENIPINILLLLSLIFIPLLGSFFIGMFQHRTYRDVIIGMYSLFICFIFVLCLFISLISLSMPLQKCSFLLLPTTLSFNGCRLFLFTAPGIETINLTITSTSIFFIVLSIILVFLCIMVMFEQIFTNRTLFIQVLLLLSSVLNAFFLMGDALTFYICFEFALFPIFLIIGLWGARERKIHANYLLFLYTLFGAVWFLSALLLLYTISGTFYFLSLSTFEITHISDIFYFIWIALFIGFIVKVPMWPVHLWLPEAHVEAPTTGSVILAGILLKLGTYGIYVFLFYMLPKKINFIMSPVAMFFSFFGIVITSIITLRQIDIKKIIAYSSVAHMSGAILALYTYTYFGILGGVFLMFSHGIVSSALFFSIGVIYSRAHTRLIAYLSGLIYFCPLFSLYFFLFSISNFGFPSTSNFVGELLLFLGLINANYIAIPFFSISFLLSSVYSIWLYNRICLGKPSHVLNDLQKQEVFIMSILLWFNYLLGIFPMSLISHLLFTTEILMY